MVQLIYFYTRYTAIYFSFLCSFPSVLFSTHSCISSPSLNASAYLLGLYHLSLYNFPSPVNYIPSISRHLSASTYLLFISHPDLIIFSYPLSAAHFTSSIYLFLPVVAHSFSSFNLLL